MHWSWQKVMLPLLGVCVALGAVLPAQAATRIRFASGSYCGSYSGNFSGGREFVLNLGSGQTLTSRNTGEADQYDITVFGPAGRVPGRKTSQSMLEYSIPVTGDYYISVRSEAAYNSVEFCAY